MLLCIEASKPSLIFVGLRTLPDPGLGSEIGYSERTISVRPSHESWRRSRGTVDGERQGSSGFASRKHLPIGLIFHIIDINITRRRRHEHRGFIYPPQVEYANAKLVPTQRKRLCRRDLNEAQASGTLSIT
jgi:hypothetical protein